MQFPVPYRTDFSRVVYFPFFVFLFGSYKKLGPFGFLYLGIKTLDGCIVFTYTDNVKESFWIKNTLGEIT